MRPSLCVVLHDVADSTLGDCERLLRDIEAVAPVPLTWLAVPRHHGQVASPSLEQWLGQRCAAGDEISLHGFTHFDDLPPRGHIDHLRRRIYTRGEGEFWALTAADAGVRLLAGAAWFERQGWPLQGFVAPAWLMGPGTWQALGMLPSLRYASTLRQIHPLPLHRCGVRPIESQSIVYSTSSGPRRMLSTGWAALCAAAQQQRAVLRLELHPRDGAHRAIRHSWQGILERALMRREAMTVAQIVDRWCSEASSRRR